LARKVKVRPWRQYDPQQSQDAAAYAFYKKEMTYRWAVICQGCYARLDNAVGVAGIGGRRWGPKGQSLKPHKRQAVAEKYAFRRSAKHAQATERRRRVAGAATAKLTWCDK